MSNEARYGGPVFCSKHYFMVYPGSPCRECHIETIEAELQEYRKALDKSCLCGDFGYITDDDICPACEALIKTQKLNLGESDPRD